MSLATLRRWASEGLVGATTSRTLSPRNVVRLYGFDDLVALMVLSALRDVKSHQTLRKVVSRLRAEYARPLVELRFAIDPRRGEIYFQHTDGTWEGDRKPSQIVAVQVLDLQEIRTRIRDHAHAPRRADEVGSTERKRGRVGSKEVFRGTRIPVDTVREYLRAGADDAEILEAFPRLTSHDIGIVRREPAAK